MKLALLPLLALSLTAQTPEPPKPPTPPVTPKVDAAPKAEAKKENKIVAVVGQDVIRDADIDAVLEAIPQVKQQLAANPNGRAIFIQNYAEVRLMALKARKLGLDKKPDYKLKLELQEDQLLRGEFLNTQREALQAKMAITDDELKAYFEKNTEKFRVPEKFSARHILVSTQEDPVTPEKDAKPEDVAKAREAAKAAKEEAAKAKLAKIQDALKGGKKLEELVKDYTDDPGSKETGGLYEDFDPASMVPSFSDAVRKQEIGVVGEPVKTDYGYHLIQVTKKTPSRLPAFDEVKEKVRSTMGPERQEAVGKAFMDALKAEIPCVTGDAAVEAAKRLPAKQTGANAQKKPSSKGKTK